jgi:hypothetical protein
MNFIATSIKYLQEQSFPWNPLKHWQEPDALSQSPLLLHVPLPGHSNTKKQINYYFNYLT